MSKVHNMQIFPFWETQMQLDLSEYVTPKTVYCGKG
jgi:hypothetical protein